MHRLSCGSQGWQKNTHLFQTRLILGQNERTVPPPWVSWQFFLLIGTLEVSILRFVSFYLYRSTEHWSTCLTTESLFRHYINLLKGSHHHHLNLLDEIMRIFPIDGAANRLCSAKDLPHSACKIKLPLHAACRFTIPMHYIKAITISIVTWSPFKYRKSSERETLVWWRALRCRCLPLWCSRCGGCSSPEREQHVIYVDIWDLVVEREIGGYKWIFGERKFLNPPLHGLIILIITTIVIIMASEPFCDPCVAP